MSDTFIDFNEAEQRINRVKAMMDHIRDSGNIYIFGAGLYALRLKDYLESLNIEIKGFFVDDGYEDRAMAGPVFPLSSLFDFEDICLIYGMGGGYSSSYYETTDRIRQKTEERKGASFYVMPGDYWMAEAGHLTHEVIDIGYIKEHISEFKDTFDRLEDDLSREVMKEYLYSSITGDSLRLADLGTSPEHDYDLDLLFAGCGEGTVLECGAFDGESIVQMAEYTRCRYPMIALECDEDNYIKCVANTKDYSNIDVIKLGAWDKKARLAIIQSSEASYIMETEDGSEDGIIVDVEAVDSILNGKKAAALIMDIEGSELKALQGARNVIAGGANLAIRVYHRKGDLIDIPRFISEINSSYKYYVRFNRGANLCRTGDETTLYAIAR